MTTLAPDEFIILVNVNPAAFSQAVSQDSTHFRFLKTTEIRPDFQVSDGLRHGVLHKVASAIANRIRAAAPTAKLHYVNNLNDAADFVAGIQLTHPDEEEKPRAQPPPDPPLNPAPPERLNPAPQDPPLPSAGGLEMTLRECLN